MNNILIYSVSILIIFLIILISMLLRNIYLRSRAEKELRLKNEELTAVNEELTAVYEEIAASEEELKENMYMLMEKQDELTISEERYRIVMESTADIIWEGDLVNNKRIFSERLYDVLGYETYELEALDAWFKIVHPEDVERVRKDIKKQIDEKIGVKTFEYRVRCKDGSYKWVLSNTRCEFNEDGKAATVFGAFTDITKLKEQQQKIIKLAYYDSVTDLPNRVMLREEVTKEIEKSQKYGSKFALFFMDLDNFKVVNDSYGHMVGDKLLLEVAERLKEIQDENMMAFRLGGDEFNILIKDVVDKEEVEMYSEAILKAIQEPVFIDGNMFRVTHSGGIVLYPENGLTFDELLKNADTAMYKSKEAGKCIYTFYNSHMGDNALEKVVMQADLHKALENEEFMLYYQPIIDTSEGIIRGFESLIRWSHPENGIIPPGKFISAAEENGTIIQIGEWVITNACKYAKSIYDQGFTDLFVSVNVSAVHLIQKDFTDFVLSVLEDTGLPAELLLIEITESILMESIDFVIENLNKLKENNVKIALDDFGCGYSSLTYLRKLPINIVKIDKSFIDDIKSEDDLKSMAGTIVLLAKQLGLSVIGEGVEIEEQLGYLKKHGCDMFQGYLASRPVPEAEANKLLETAGLRLPV